MIGHSSEFQVNCPTLANSLIFFPHPPFQKVLPLLSCVLQPPNLALPSSGNFATLTSWNSISRMHDNLF
jgi:hypothetical protein